MTLLGRKSAFININLISGLNVGAKSSADLSTLFDIGGIFGGIIAGLISDLTGMSALTCGGSFLLTVPLVFIFYMIASDWKFIIFLPYFSCFFIVFMDL